MNEKIKKDLEQMSVYFNNCSLGLGEDTDKNKTLVDLILHQFKEAYIKSQTDPVSSLIKQLQTFKDSEEEVLRNNPEILDVPFQNWNLSKSKDGLYSVNSIELKGDMRPSILGVELRDHVFDDYISKNPDDSLKDMIEKNTAPRRVKYIFEMLISSIGQMENKDCKQSINFIINYYQNQINNADFHSACKSIELFNDVLKEVLNGQDSNVLSCLMYLSSHDLLNNISFEKVITDTEYRIELIDKIQEFNDPENFNRAFILTEDQQCFPPSLMLKYENDKLQMNSQKDLNSKNIKEF